MPVGIAYAIWAGSGTALIVLVGAMLFKQSPDTDALIRIALILAGIVVINLGVVLDLSTQWLTQTQWLPAPHHRACIDRIGAFVGGAASPVVRGYRKSRCHIL